MNGCPYITSPQLLMVMEHLDDRIGPALERDGEHFNKRWVGRGVARIGTEKCSEVGGEDREVSCQLWRRMDAAEEGVGGTWGGGTASRRGKEGATLEAVGYGTRWKGALAFGKRAGKALRSLMPLPGAQCRNANCVVTERQPGCAWAFALEPMPDPSALPPFPRHPAVPPGPAPPPSRTSGPATPSLVK